MICSSSVTKYNWTLNHMCFYNACLLTNSKMYFFEKKVVFMFIFWLWETLVVKSLALVRSILLSVLMSRQNTAQHILKKFVFCTEVTFKFRWMDTITKKKNIFFMKTSVPTVDMWSAFFVAIFFFARDLLIVNRTSSCSQISSQNCIYKKKTLKLGNQTQITF